MEANRPPFANRELISAKLKEFRDGPERSQWHPCSDFLTQRVDYWLIYMNPQGTKEKNRIPNFRTRSHKGTQNQELGKDVRQLRTEARLLI